MKTIVEIVNDKRAPIVIYIAPLHIDSVGGYFKEIAILNSY